MATKKMQTGGSNSGKTTIKVKKTIPKKIVKDSTVSMYQDAYDQAYARNSEGIRDRVKIEQARRNLNKAVLKENNKNKGKAGYDSDGIPLSGTYKRGGVVKKKTVIKKK